MANGIQPTLAAIVVACGFPWPVIPSERGRATMKTIQRTGLVVGVVLSASLLAGAQPAPVGALAVDERQGDQWGWAVDYETAGAAHGASLRECGPGCSVVLTFARCAAYAADQDAASTAVGWAESYASANEAQQAALGECSSRGGSGCTVRVWGCNGPVVEEGLGFDRAARREIQAGLQAAGFDPGGADGLFGPRTRAAIRGWQASRGAQTTGYLDGAAVEALRRGDASGLAVAEGAAGVEMVFWQSVVNSTNPADFEAYLTQFPNGAFRVLAQNRLSALGAPGGAASASAATGVGGAGSPASNSRVFGTSGAGSRIATGVDSDSRPGEVFRPDQTCTSGGASCWVEISGEPGCYAWNASFRWRINTTATWTGECSGGLAKGEGSLTLGVSEYRERVATGQLVDGKQRGHWVERWVEGVEEGSYVDGARHGHWVHRYTSELSFLDGAVYEGPYVDGAPHGRWVRRYTNGGVAGGLYVDGKPDGYWVEINPAGNFDEGPYVDGRKNGRWVVRYREGRVGEGLYVDGARTGNWVMRYATGTVHEGPYVGYQRTGNWVERYANGGVSGGPYVDGKKHGNWVERFASGQIEEGPYVDGKRHGNWVVRWASGGVNDVQYADGERGVSRRRR